ncbi:MAG: glycosyltransferase family 4 protein [Candidatus Methanoperedens sp.]|nr:glycosyltransferase family 4 protein [Candidatus Methanoperedens sp.]
MKILVIYTNPNVVLKDTGTKARLVKLFKLFSNKNNLIFLSPLTEQNKSANVNIMSTYQFRQLSIFKNYLAVFTDFNFDYIIKIRRIIKKEKIDFIFITLPYGVISASFFCRNVPIIYGAEFVIRGTSPKLVSMHFINTFNILKNNFIGSAIGRIVGSIFSKYLIILEQLACNRSSHIIAISESDKQKLIKHYNIEKNKITVIPHCMSLTELNNFALEREETIANNIITVVFHGSYKDHPVNYKAFMQIIDYIAPEVEKYNRNIKFLLAGTDAPVFERRNIKSLGFVEDIPNLLKHSDIAIVPFNGGSGIKIKIFDYMAAGLPIISTKNGIEGINLQNGKHAIIIDTVNQKFIDAILDLARDNNKRDIIGRNALDLVRTRYSEECVQAEINKMLVKLKGN